MPSSRVFSAKDKALNVRGQGTFVFSCQASASFIIFSDDKKSGIAVELTKEGISVCATPSGEELSDPENKSGIVDDPQAFYWFSLDSQNQVLYAGTGEPRLETIEYAYAFPANVHESNKIFLESLTHIVAYDDGMKTLRILRDPITASIPLRVKGTPDLTMDDIAQGNFVSKANLSATSQKLYDCIAGPQFTLNTPDFPDFSRAIEYSIVTPGQWCYETLLKKATEFNKDKPDVRETYLRITLGQNNGESPGIPYVMEIWPAGHYSPVHSHAGAEAVIRVLEGGIHVRLFPYLSGKAEAFGTADFLEDDVMWISPTLNQTHQLVNTSNETCITIQCYMYDEKNNSHYDYFDYIDSDGAIKQYEPDSDMDFVAFKKLMRDSWKPCCRR
jgi:uncharacterized RmlC-like cupin family protein